MNWVIPAAVVITAGFAEADADSERLQAELGAAIEEYDIDVCGPNCIGLANACEGTVLTSTRSRAPNPSSIGLVSQSGALAFTTFFERAADEDINFAYIASTGNEVDLSLTDYVEWMADQPAVEVVCAYIEGIDDPRRFMRVADEAARSKTPVLVVKVGHSEMASAASRSHTGSLTGSDGAWSAAFEQVGVERVPDIPDLLSRANAHTAFDPPASDRVCIASTSGGLASLLTDLAAERGLSLPALDGEMEQHLLDMEELLTFGELHNPVDIRGYGAKALPEIAGVLFADDGFDAYVFAIGLSAVGDEAEDIADGLLSVVDAADDPVFFLWTGRTELDDPDPDPVQPFERVRRETPLYYDPSRCLDAVASLVAAGEARDRTSPSRAELASAAGPDLDLPDGVLTWQEAEPLLEACNIPIPETWLAGAADEAVAHADVMGYPVVLKVDSADVPHRTDADAVRVGLEEADDVRAAYREIRGNVDACAPEADIAGVLVQRQHDGVEALVGISQEAGFGPVVTVGPGGTLVELVDDAAIRVPPLSTADAREAIEATALADLLAGHRGATAGDPAALADLLVRVGRLATEAEAVRELDLNPVVVDDEGAVALDVLVRTGYPAAKRFVPRSGTLQQSTWRLRLTRPRSGGGCTGTRSRTGGSSTRRVSSSRNSSASASTRYTSDRTPSPSRSDSASPTTPTWRRGGTAPNARAPAQTSLRRPRMGLPAPSV